MSNPSSAPASNGQARAGHPVDWTGYPALFQRVAPTSQTYETVETSAEPAPVIGQTGGIREAFLGFCQAALFTPEYTRRFDRPSEVTAAARAIAAGEAFGFTREELQRLGCGLYTGPALLAEQLHSVGFRDADIETARLVADDAGRPRSELADSLVVPLTDESGQICDFLLLTVSADCRGFSGYRFLYGPAHSNVVVYGLQTALSRPLGLESLVLVDDVFEALLLQCRGLRNVAAVGARGTDLSPRRWEELARLGVATVTLAFRRDARHSADVRDALVNALRAKTAPQVYVANPYPGGERSAADVFRRFGKDTCAVALSARSLAFHDKDFGEADRARPRYESIKPFVAARSEQKPKPPVPAPQPPVVSGEPHYREAYRRHLAELAASLPAEDRYQAEELIAAFDRSVVTGAWARAAWFAGRSHQTPFAAWPTGYGAWPGTFGWTGFANPAWAFEPAWLSPPTQVNEAKPTSVQTGSAVLDQLVRSSHRAEIPPHLASYAGREKPSAVEWIVDSSTRDRLATLCERVVDACERRPGQSFVIVCCEQTEQQMMLALTTHLAARLSDGQGLTIEEVRTRLAGGEPITGYRDKPWLADEAADRLRRWSPRLTFVSCSPNSAGRAAIEQAVEAARAKSSFGGIYFDSLPNTGWHGATDPSLLAWLNDLATRCGGQVFATAASAPVVLTVPHPAAAWSFPMLPTHGWASTAWNSCPWLDGPTSSPRLLQTDGGRTILSTLGDWLRRECEARSAAA